MKNRCRWNSVFITGISMLTFCSELMCRTEMPLNYQIQVQLYVDFCHIVQKVVLVFFSASFRGLLLSSSLQGGIKLHARYNLTLSSFIYSYSPDLMQILYLGMFISFWIFAFHFSLLQHDQFRKNFWVQIRVKHSFPMYSVNQWIVRC